ncbi:MAG: TPM domain-containing protein [Candidatus Eremiobacteraeota bacterium]|nr:TPM domain-containing protein [Candidatus Eremiobacteraeota bacterium]MBC5826153.1 TPM domain-containing protein [Candidatus Eremiobacteraeota bacterium]
MTPRPRHRLARYVDDERVQAAIDAAESRTTGRIQVALAHGFWGDVRAAAERAFTRLHVAGAPDRNGVLFFVVPTRRKFVVLGDAGIHQEVGQEFWHRTTAALRERFKNGDLTGGLVHGIDEAGKELARHFPRRPQGQARRD